MNNIELEDVKGILNYLAGTTNFFCDYGKVNKAYGYCVPMLYDSVKSGLLLEIDDGKTLDISIGIRSYLNLKTFSDKHTRDVPFSYSLFNMMSSFYGVNFICFFVKGESRGVYSAYAVAEKDKRIFCSNICLTDVICINRTMNCPIFVNKKLIEKEVEDNGKKM